MANNANDRQIFPPNMIRLCIDRYDDEIKGRIYNKMCDAPMEFDNCCEMLIKADNLFERIGYPQSFCDSRNFVTGTVKGHYKSPGKPLADNEELQKQEGEICTLDVVICSRRQGSWQGVIKAKTESPVHEFRCGMELLRYIEKMIGKEHNMQTGSIT